MKNLLIAFALILSAISSDAGIRPVLVRLEMDGMVSVERKEGVEKITPALWLERHGDTEFLTRDTDAYRANKERIDLAIATYHAANSPDLPVAIDNPTERAGYRNRVIAVLSVCVVMLALGFFTEWRKRAEKAGRFNR